MLDLQSASLDHLQDILELLRACALPEPGVADAIGNFIVARSSVGLVGCAGMEVWGDVGLLRSVAVEARARKRGLGRNLVEGVVASARQRGLRELYLLTTTAPEFFAGLGFVPAARSLVPDGIAGSWEFQVGCPKTAQLMKLEL